MKIIFINSFNYGSTGNIVRQLMEKMNNKAETYFAYPYTKLSKGRKKSNDIIIGNRLFRFIDSLFCRLTGNLDGLYYFSTIKLINTIKKINPDIVHLHNIHGGFLNIYLLFKYFKKNNIRVIWTLHDCWAFTGRCPHFTMLKCNKWKTQCTLCPYPKNNYPRIITRKENELFLRKQSIFLGVKNLTIVTPSQWLSNLVRESFLGTYRIKTIYNGIDLKCFKERKSSFRQKYGLENTYIVLCVSFMWHIKKGFDVVIELSKLLPSNYRIVIVGTNEENDKRLSDNVISIHRTQCKDDLADIYSAADVFFNPTREEVLGLVNIESLACGTPVVTFKTGGCPEILTKKTGIVLEQNTIEEALSAIENVCENKPFSKKECLDRASYFDMDKRYDDYVELYLTDK